MAIIFPLNKFLSILVVREYLMVNVVSKSGWSGQSKWNTALPFDR